MESETLWIGPQPCREYLKESMPPLRSGHGPNSRDGLVFTEMELRGGRKFKNVKRLAKAFVSRYQ